MSQGKRIHFISIGGSVMHNLAIALQQQGYEVTGSDDEIYEPSRSRLLAAGLLPETEGWAPEKIGPHLDAVILGMHARADNPELARAKALGLRVYSYPEYVFEQSSDKQRVVVAGSHGKTTITSMILHVLKHTGRDFNYLVGAKLDGFEQTVRLDDKPPLIVIEGDEYFSSPLDKTPKFLHYRPHIAVISGIAWDHYNVFPTWESYTGAFEQLCDGMQKAGTLIYDETDDALAALAGKPRKDVNRVPYDAFPSFVRDGRTYLDIPGRNAVSLQVFGRHNLKNIRAAWEVCERLAVTEEEFYDAIAGFKGASKRLELVGTIGGTSLFYRDFAHAPSKVEATTKAVKAQFPDRKLVACAELHTFSSLNREFLSQYRHKLDAADEALLFYSPHTLEQKRLPPLTSETLTEAFQRPDLRIFTDPLELKKYLLQKHWDRTNLLMMSSGVFGGLDLTALGEELRG